MFGRTSRAAMPPLLLHISCASSKISAGTASLSPGPTNSYRRAMTLEEFQQSLSGNEPPAGISHALTALWWDAKGDWNHAHSNAMLDKNKDGSWVHAYLHRKEGDRSE